MGDETAAEGKLVPGRLFKLRSKFSAEVSATEASTLISAASPAEANNPPIAAMVTTQQHQAQGRPVGQGRRWHGAASHHLCA